MEDAVDLILHEKPSGILLSLREDERKYASVLAKENECTYTHVLKILNELKNLGLVEFQKEGRIKYVDLTGQGEDVAHALEGLTRQLQKLDEDKTGPEPEGDGGEEPSDEEME